LTTKSTISILTTYIYVVSKRREKSMKRVVLLLSVMAVALVVGSGVALAAVKIGTDGHDVLKGTKGEDVIHGRGSWDVISGVGSDDVLYGDEGSDSIHGGSFDLDEIFDGRRMVPDGEDKIYGGDGKDCVWGGSEDDVLYGGAGNDFVGTYCLDFVMDTGNDVMYAGSGNDFVMAVEAPDRYQNLQERDVVYCGPGKDTVYFTKGVDQIFGCERKNPR
jgi:Ca2+-binding RTX toxin-like protein